MKRLFANLILSLTAAFGLMGSSMPVAASSITTAGHFMVAAQCGSVKTSIDYGCTSNSGGAIYGFLRAIIKFASGLVGLVVIMMLIIGGIRYTTSAGNPKLVAAARMQIVNSIIGLVLFGLMLAILNFILPGGVIG